MHLAATTRCGIDETIYRFAAGGLVSLFRMKLEIEAVPILRKRQQGIVVFVCAQDRGYRGARIAGASTIIASDPVAQRRQAATAFGATHVIDPINEDLAALCLELTGGIGVDYVFEAAGKAMLVEQGINLSRMGGTTVCVGAPALEESITISPAVLFAATEKKLCGCLLGSSNSLFEIPRLIRLWKQGLLDMESMITSRRPLHEINQGFDDLANSRGIRTVIEIG